MVENKTKENTDSVTEFLETIEDPKKRQDAYALVKLFYETTGYEPKMWGTAIIGFGSYHYKYASGHEDDSCRVGLSPRKSAISIYLSQPDDEHRAELLARLGKHTMGKGCLYIKKLKDIDLQVLKELVQESVQYTKKRYAN